MTPLLAAMLGLSPSFLNQERKAERVHLTVQAASALLSMLVFALSSGYGARTVGASVVSSALVGLGMALIVLNLLRLLNAGAGIALSLRDDGVEAWRPSAFPLLVFAALCSALSQPALVSLLGTRGDADVTHLRTQLVSIHEQAVLDEPLARRASGLSKQAALSEEQRAARLRLAALTDESSADNQIDLLTTRQRIEALGTELAHAQVELEEAERKIAQLRAENLVPYARHLEGMAFPLTRLRRIWTEPLLAGLLTLVYSVLACAPMLLRSLWPSGVRDYEARKRRRERSLVEGRHRQVSERIDALHEDELRRLSRLRHYTGRRQRFLAKPRYLDPPFNTQRVVTSYERAKALGPDALWSRLALEREEP